MLVGLWVDIFLLGMCQQLLLDLLKVDIKKLMENVFKGVVEQEGQNLLNNLLGGELFGEEGEGGEEKKLNLFSGLLDLL